MDRTPSLLRELGRRIERARLDRDWSQAVLAREAGVSKRTLERLEHGESVHLKNLARVLQALGFAEALPAMLPAVGDQPMEQLRLDSETGRRRASGKTRSATEPWTWGDEE